MKAITPAILLLAVAGCGVASVAPLVTNADVAHDPRLAGTWEDPKGKEFATITAVGSASYRLEYHDDDGKTGRFTARLGRLGTFQILDVQPDDPAPNASDLYRSLLLPAHGLVVVDSIGAVLQFRIIDADSLKAYLLRQPGAVPHTKADDNILLTGSSREVRRFLAEFIGRPGVLGEPAVWRRRQG